MQGAILQTEALQQGLEGAILALVAELDSRIVKGDCAFDLLRRAGKGELGLRVTRIFSPVKSWAMRWERGSRSTWSASLCTEP